MKLRVGDWVEVRSKGEILATLDREGRLDSLPFMPQMFQYCGQRFKVFKSAHKTCDTVNQTGGRRLFNAVHLETRCDGNAYGGCQAACLIFWKTAWLKPVSAEKASVRHSSVSAPMATTAQIDNHSTNHKLSSPLSCTEKNVWEGTKVDNTQPTEEPRYICQATQLPFFTRLLPWWDIRQYIEDYTSGNVTLGRMFRGFIYAGYYHTVQSGIGIGEPLRWLYDGFQKSFGGIPYPRRAGKIPVGQTTPSVTLDLQPGEMVRVKSYKDILSTLNTEYRNRGLWFDAEHVPYCGGVYRVRSRVTRIINEKSGKMMTFDNVSIILEGVVCQARYSSCRMFCPRSIYPWWREIWLERETESTRGK